MNENKFFTFTCARILLCILFLAISLYAYIDRRNHVVALQMRIPEMTKIVKLLNEENTRLRFEVELFEGPAHLMKLASSSSFSHLKYPVGLDVVTVYEPIDNTPLPTTSSATPPWLIAGIGW